MKSQPEYRYNGGFEPLRSTPGEGTWGGGARPGSSGRDAAGRPVDDPQYHGRLLRPDEGDGVYYFPLLLGSGEPDPHDGIYYFPPGLAPGEVAGGDGDGMYYFPPALGPGEVADREGTAPTARVIDGGRGGPGYRASMHSAAELVPEVYSDSDGAVEANRPLTVAHVGPFLLRGGAEQWLVDLARSLDPAKLRIVRAIATRGDLMDFEYASQLAQQGITVEVGGAESIRAAARECDVLLSWGIELDQYLGDVRAPVSVHVVHGDGPMNLRFLNGSVRTVDHVVAVSHGVRERVCRGRSTTVIYNGVDVGRLVSHRPRSEARARLGYARGDFVVGFFGRMASEKRVGQIIDAVAMLPERFKLLMVGWGIHYPDLLEHARRTLGDRHRFAYTSTSLGELYRAVDAVCLASNQEGFPLVMLEAFSCGRPFLTTPVGSAREIIEDRVNGILFDGGSASLAAALRRLAGYPEWRRGVGRSGRRTFERFGTARRMARDYEHLVRQLWAEKYAA